MPNVSPLEEDVAREIDRLDRRILAIEHVALRYAVIDVELSTIKEDVAELKTLFATRAVERARERDTSARDRKADRRWMIGVISTATGLVIAAMAILLPALSNGGHP